VKKLKGAKGAANTLPTAANLAYTVKEGATLSAPIYGLLQGATDADFDHLYLRVTQRPKNAKTFTPPTRELETRVKHRRFRHDGNTCLRWQASNVVVDRRIDDSLLPKKEAPESPNKIDGIDALLLAVGGWLRAASVPEPTYSVLVMG